MHCRYQHQSSVFSRLLREFQRMSINVGHFHGVVCVQRHESMEDAVSRTRREIRWRSLGSQQSQQLSIDLLVTEWIKLVLRTRSQSVVWLLAQTTSSHCGLSTVKDFAATTSRAPAVQVSAADAGFGEGFVRESPDKLVPYFGRHSL